MATVSIGGGIPPFTTGTGCKCCGPAGGCYCDIGDGPRRPMPNVICATFTGYASCDVTGGSAPAGDYYDGFDYTPFTGMQYTLTRDPTEFGVCPRWKAAVTDANAGVDSVACPTGSRLLALNTLQLSCVPPFTATLCDPTHPSNVGGAYPGSVGGPLLAFGAGSSGLYSYTAGGHQYVGNCCAGTRTDNGNADNTNTRWGGISLASALTDYISKHRFHVTSCDPFAADLEVYLNSGGRYPWSDGPAAEALVLTVHYAEGACGMMALAPRLPLVEAMPCPHRGKKLADAKSCCDDGGSVYACDLYDRVTLTEQRGVTLPNCRGCDERPTDGT